ncbi:MAG TPA: CHASE2 domain-containing protein, partial [Sphingomicrobium sp.]|nr:CHASE2 domain-containing protein [Sphingomicrobium sp.]
MWPAWAIGIALALLLSLVTGAQTSQFLFDRWQKASLRAIPATNLRVVLIDDKSLAFIGPWPWSRYYLARLTEDIARDGAKVIGYDVLFPEPDRAKPELFAKLYPELSPSASSEVSALPSMDQVFGQVIGRSPVVIARAGASEGVRDGRSLAVDATITGSLPIRIDTWPAAITAIPEIEDVALGHGLVNDQPDPDGTIRSVPLIMRVAGKPMPGLALELARLDLGSDGVRTYRDHVDLSRRQIPIDQRGRMHLRFGKFPTPNIVSAAAILGKGLPRGYFRNKIVLVGLAAEGTSDIVSTPIASENFGVIVQAEAVDTILAGGWLARPQWMAALEWGLALAMALLALASAWSGKAPRIALATAFVALPVAGWLAFDRLSLLLDAVRPFEI